MDTLLFGQFFVICVVLALLVPFLLLIRAIIRWLNRH